MGLLALALAPAAAGAASHEQVEIRALTPSQSGGTFGPATHYPSTIGVSGLSGRVTQVTVTLIGVRSSSGDDIDAALTGPNGKTVMLMSDACGLFESFDSSNFFFNDFAPGFLPNGPLCGATQDGRVLTRPTNYVGNSPEPDDISAGGGPPPPYLNSLSSFDGISPNGAWKLFITDDDGSAGLGFVLPAWSLKLDYQPVAPKSKCKKRTGKKGAVAKKKCRKKKK